tara:strand:+ start:1723 stop:2208 length:486 start_codon:yes stop_codon:yes gene_type:complete
MSRTDELKAAGAVARTKEVSTDASMEPAPYVRWGDEYAYVEGQVLEIWDSPKGYGESVSMALSGCSDHLMGKLGTEMVAISAGQKANVGLGSATLQGTITAEDVQQGKHFHVAFMRWQEPANGNRYRVFAVIEVAAPDAEEQGIVALKVPAAEIDDDELPF